MISTGELKKGLTILYDNELMRIADFQHVKQGRGSAYVRMTLRNVRTGATVNTTVQAGEKFPTAQLEKKTVQFLYREDDTFYFMDTATYDQPAVGASVIGEAIYLVENEEVDLLTYKGDTASGAVKPAIMETGLRVIVPLFISEGDDLRIDTRTGTYIERA